MSSFPLGPVARSSFLSACLFLCVTASARAAGGGDDCASPEAITGFSFVSFTLVGATNSPELVVEPPCFEHITRDVWFAWTAPKTCWVRVLRNSPPPLYHRVYDGAGCPTPGTILDCSSSPFLVSAGSVYTVRVGVENATPAQSGTIRFEDLTPLEDSCATPRLFIGDFGFAETKYALTGAEGQNQPACSGPGGLAINQDVWLSWTASFSGPAVLEACGVNQPSTGNRKAAIYLGSSCPTSAPIACDDDSCGALQPRMAFTAVTGQDYLIQAGRSPADTSSASVQGSLRIYSSLPLVLNDECATARVVNAGTIFYDLTGATTSPEGGTCGPMSRDLWFLWVATSTGQATFSSCGSGPDALISVYAGASCPPGPMITCGDEGCISYGPAIVVFPVVCGQAYMLRFGNYAAPVGPALGSLSLSVTGSACGTFSAFCTGDSGPACPCANAGWPGRGCASSFAPHGALFYGSGTASLSADTVQVRVTGASPSFVTLLQGTTQQSGGAGLPFGDGLLCAGGSLTRLLIRLANGGQLDYPAAGDIPLSVLGQVQVAATRTYQGWYRDSSLTFCASGTFNMTNGFEIAWSP